MKFLFDTRLRMLWATVSAIGAGVLIAVEVLLVRAGMSSPLAPTPTIFAACLAGGITCGVIGIFAERHDLLHHRQWRLHVLRLPHRERFRWPALRENLRRTGWFIALLYALLGCCWFWDANIFPSLLAANAVMGFANKKLVRDFHRELVTTA